ncbi:MAG: nuclear transport factor 2 family protein [Bryobacteraceae bacterium]
MKKTVCIVFGLLMIAGGAMAQSKASDEAALKAIEEKWDAANLKGDAAALASIFADGFITTSNEGKVRGKVEMVAEVKSGDIKYQTAKVEDMKVYVYGDTAIVNGKWTGKFTLKGKPVTTVERYTDTYARQNGKWLCVASHGSSIK